MRLSDSLRPPARPRRRLGDERGMVVIMVAFLIPVFIGLAALAGDAGLLWSSAAGVRGAADSAAIAGARALENVPPGGGATDQTYHCAAPGPGVDTVATHVACRIALANDSKATGTITTPWSTTGCTGACASLQIHVDIQESTPTFFGKIFGFNSVTNKAVATAKNGGPLGTGYWAMPFAVSGGAGCGRTNGDAPCICSYYSTTTQVCNTETPPAGALFQYIAYHHLGSCTGATGSFCFTNLAGTTSLSETATNDATMQSWITGGYPNPLTVPKTTGDYVTCDVGKTCAGAGATNHCGHVATPSTCVLIQALNARAGQIILVPVFDPATTKSTFSLIGFAVFKLSSSPYFQNPKDTAHWYLTGTYLANIVCQPPPGDAGNPSECFGLPGSGQNYGVTAPIGLTQ